MNLATSRENKRFFDRAHRRALNTGLPISRAIEIETQRAASRKSTRRIYPGSQPFIGETRIPHLPDGSNLRITNDPEHEAVLPISEAPSPIPEENENLTDKSPEQAAAADIESEQKGYAEDDIPGTEDPAVDPTKAEDEAAFAADVAQEVAAKQKNIGRPVSWTQMGKEYRGTISHVIPPNANPRDMGIEAGAKPKKGEAAKTRDHISYVVKNDESGALAWPMRSSLTVLDAE